MSDSYFQQASFTCYECQTPICFTLSQVQDMIADTCVNCPSCQRAVQASVHDQNVMADIVNTLASDKKGAYWGTIAWSVFALCVILFLHPTIGFAVLTVGLWLTSASKKPVPAAQNEVVVKAVNQSSTLSLLKKTVPE